MNPSECFSPAADKRRKAGTICMRCIIDTSVPGFRIDGDGICHYCRVHEEMEKEYPNDERGSKYLESHIARVKKAGRKKRYDCLVGLSGGRDSSFTLYLAKKIWGLRPLAVHFNDGFGNPVAGENMKKATQKLGVELRTVTSDWRESKDIRIAFLKASTPDFGTPTDIGIANALYATAVSENIRHVMIGQSFRTEGIAPLEWNYLDGRYLLNVHKLYGTVPLRKWTPENPGFRLTFRHLSYYSLWKRIRIFSPLYYYPYVRKEADEILKREIGWVYPGAHYWDDLYQSMMSDLMRKKFKIDRRIYNYSALIRSGQMRRDEALELVSKPHAIEDPKIVDLCIKRLGLSQADYEALLKEPVRTFRDYETSYPGICRVRGLIFILSKLKILPSVTYQKYFEFI